VVRRVEDDDRRERVGRLKFTDLKRDSDFLLATDGANSGDVLYWNRFLKAYDFANLDQKSWKATVDFSPVEFLDVSIEGTAKENKYKDMTLGRLKDDRRELYASVSYGNPETARFTVFGDVESVKMDSRHMVIPFGSTAIGTYDPFAPPSTSKYNWEGTARDKNWAFGAALDLRPPRADDQGVDRVLQDRRLARFRLAGRPAGATYPQPVPTTTIRSARPST